MPVIIRIAAAPQALLIIQIFLGTAFAEMKRHIFLRGDRLSVGMLTADLAAAFFTLRSAVGTMEHLAYRQDFSSSDERGTFIRFELQFSVDRYNIRHSEPHFVMVGTDEIKTQVD